MPTKPKRTARTSDATRSERARTYLQRLEESGGKRLLVDLDQQTHEALKDLMNLGYGGTNKDIVSRALNEIRMAYSALHKHD